MLAKAIRNRAPGPGGRQDFGARLRYICGKAVAISLRNLAGDWTDAAFQMRISAGLAPRVRAPVYHLVLTWAETEHPSDPDVIDAAHRVLRELGASSHQYVIAVHRDRSNTHAHVVLNKVHPLTGATWSASHDYARLEKACRRIEHAMGWPQDRGRFDVAVVDDEVRLVPKPAAYWDRKVSDRERGLRPDSRAVRGHEKRTGLPSLRDAIPGKILDGIRASLDRAKGWQDVHLAVARNGLRYILHGSGARIARTGSTWFMAACHLCAACGLQRMQHRLGAFEPDRDQAWPAAPLGLSERFGRRMHPDGVPDTPLPDVLKAIAEQHRKVRDWRDARRTAGRDLALQQGDEERRIRQTLGGKRSPFDLALRAVMRETHREQRAAWKREHPAPVTLPLDATPDLLRLAPGAMVLRRYRHVLRHMAGQTGSAADASPTDHTARRQRWLLAGLLDNARLPDALRSVIGRHPDDIRADGSGSLLLARRNPSGSIAGFDVLSITNSVADNRVTQGDGQGLGLIGRRDAPTCIVVPDIAAGLMQTALSADDQALIIVIGDSLDTRVADQLRALTQSRTTFIAYGHDPAHAETVESLRQILPEAKWRTRNPGTLWHDFVKGAALGVARVERGNAPAPS